MLLPYLMMFFSSLLISSLFIMFSTSWLLIWAALEVNLLSFIPLVSLTNKFQETESSIKYFLAQALGSATMLMSIIFLSTKPSGIYSMNILMSLLFFLSLTLKLGAAPLHFWFPSVMAGLSWMLVMLLSTWQKISPLIIISSIPSTKLKLLMVLFIMASLGALVGGWGGLNQTQLRALIAYSAIGHMGWMLSTMVLSTQLLFLYFILYSLMLFPIMLIASKNNILSTHFTTNMFFSLSTIMIMVLLISLAGLPPFLGFFPKWMVIILLSDMNTLIPTMMLISGTLMNMFYYFSILFSLFYSSSYTTMMTTKSKMIIFPTMTILACLSSFSIPSLILLMYALTFFN